jgi:hypothetical protein
VDLQSPSFTPRKPLQSDNTSHSQDDDSYSVTSSYPFFFSNMDHIEFSCESYCSVCLVSPFYLVFYAYELHKILDGHFFIPL